MVRLSLSNFCHVIDPSLDPNYGNQGARPDIAVIPLALSERGIRAIAETGVPGLLDRILESSRPIDTRMIHARDFFQSHITLPCAYYLQASDCKPVIFPPEAALSTFRLEPCCRFVVVDPPLCS